MELRHLRYFCAVAERQSFTRAARSLHVSQSAVSDQVRALENEIGATLLRRNQRDVSLTPEGVLFLREAREILAHAQRAVDLAARAAQGQHGKLSVGLCGPATAPFLPGVIREFRGQRPGVTVALKDLEPVRQPAALAEGLIDIGCTRGIPPEFRKVLASEVLFREAIIVALPEGHVLAHQATIKLTQLAAEPIILYHREGAPELFDTITGLCERAKFAPRIVAAPTQWQSVLTLVEAGEGVALLPECVQHLRSRDVVFRSLRGTNCRVNVVLAWRRNDPHLIRDGFLELLRKGSSVA